MASTLSPTQSELSAVLWSTHPSVDAMIKRSLLGKRASRSRTRFMIIFGIGVAATLACFGGIVAVALTTSVYAFGHDLDIGEPRLPILEERGFVRSKTLQRSAGTRRATAHTWVYWS